MLRTKLFGTQKSMNDLWSDNNSKLLIGAIFVLLIILIIVGFVYKDKFSNILFGPDNAKLKNLDVMFFMSPTCDWCKKMKEVLEKEGTLQNFIMVDINNEEGAKTARMYGVNGVPTFVSRTNKTGTTGLRGSTSEIIKELENVSQSGPVVESVGSENQQSQDQNPEITPDLVKDLDIIVLVSEGCGWCKKLKEDINILGYGNSLGLMEANSQEAVQVLRDFNVDTSKGVPMIISRRTGKYVIGYKPFSAITKELMTV
jgi:thioredoxin-related protein